MCFPRIFICARTNHATPIISTQSGSTCKNIQKKLTNYKLANLFRPYNQKWKRYGLMGFIRGLRQNRGISLYIFIQQQLFCCFCHLLWFCFCFETIDSCFIKNLNHSLREDVNLGVRHTLPIFHISL